MVSKAFCPYITQNFGIYQIYPLTAKPGLPLELANCKLICLEVDIDQCPRYVFGLLTSESLNLLFSQDDADSVARDYMKHRDHQRGKTLTNGSPSPSCLKVGEADILDPVKPGIQCRINAAKTIKLVNS